MDHEVQKERHPLMGLLTFLLVCLILGAGTLLVFRVYQDRCFPEDAAPMTLWQYTSGKAPRTNGIPEAQWQDAPGDGILVPEEEDTYLYIRGTLPADLSGFLHLVASNATYRVLIDGQPVLNQLGQGDSVSPSWFIGVPIPDLPGEKYVEIIAYIPFARQVSIYSGPRDLFSGNQTAHIFAAVFGVLGVLLFLLLHFRGKDTRKIGGWDFIPLACFTAAAALCLSHIPGPAWMFKAEIGCVFLIYWFYAMSLNFYLIRTAGWNSRIENLFALNLLYFVSLFLPYKTFFLEIMRNGIWLQLLNALILFFCFFRARAHIREHMAAVMVMITLINLLFWRMLSIGNLQGSLALFAAGNFMCSIYAVVAVFLLDRPAAAGTSHAPRKPRAQKPPREKKHTAEKAEAHRQTNRKTHTADLHRQIHREPERTVPDLPEEEIPEAPDVCTGLASSPRALSAMRKLVTEKAIGLNGHALHVAEYTRAICFAMGMSKDKADLISDAAMLHDVGKMVIPLDLLYKPNLTDAEFAEIRHHNIYGSQMLSGSDDSFLNLAAQIAEEHHEYVNGTGYIGLKGEEISLPARIVAVADVFDALTIYRSYKKTWSFEEAFFYISDNSGTYFDPNVVKAFQNAEENIRRVYNAYQISQSSDEKISTERSDS